MPRSFIRSRDVRATLVNSPGTELNEDLLTQGRYFEADCLAGDVVGDFVSITGAPVLGFLQVSKVNITTNETIPTVGIIVSKDTATRCFVQAFGIYTTTGLTEGARYWIGSDSRLTTTKPAGEAQSVGAALSDTELLLHLEFSASTASVIAEPVTCFVFRPGGVAAENVYTDWATVVTALGNAEGRLELCFDDSITSPIVIPAGGPYEMKDVVWTGDESLGNGTQVEIAEGASFTNWRKISRNLQVDFTGTTPPVTDMGSAESFVIQDLAELTATGPGPAIRITSAVQAIISLRLGGQLGDGTSTVVDASVAGVQLIVNGYAQLEVEENAISGHASSFFIPIVSGSNDHISLNQPAFLGTVISGLDSMTVRWEPSSSARTTPAGTAVTGDLFRYDTTGGSITQPLQEASNIYPGETVWFVKEAGAADVLIEPFAGDTIGGSASPLAISKIGDSVCLLRSDVSDSNWIILHADNQTADALATTGADVVISAAAPGITGDILKLTSPTTATWQADAGGAAVSNTPPVDVDKSAASAGVSVDASRQDHKHDVSTAAAVELTDSTNAEGVATSLTRSDHTHAHGDRGGGSLHADATPSVDGFMSAADKTKLDLFSATPSHSDLANLTADDHTQYLLLAGRAGGQVAVGGTGVSEELEFRGSTAVDAGIIRFDSPLLFNATPATNTAYCIATDFTAAVTSSFIGGVFNASPTVTFTNAVFIWEGLRVAPDIQSLVAPAFAAFTMFQGLPLLRAGSGAGHNPLNPLVMNAGPNIRNEFSGTRTSATASAINWAGQISATTSGAVMNVTNWTGLQSSPKFSTVAGSTISFGTIRGVWCQIPAVALFQTSAGVENMTAYIGLDYDNMAAFGGNVTKVAVRSAQTAATNAYFLQQTGTAQSVFNGQVRFDTDITGITFGASQDVQQGWGAGGFWFMQFNALVDQLRISNPSADRFLFDASTLSEFNFNCDKFSLGTQTGAVGNSKGVFVAGAETVTVGGEYSQFLLTQSATDTLNAAMGVYSGWTINAPSPTVGTGSLTTGIGLNIGGNPSTASTNRIGLRIISNPSGGSGINAALWVTAGLSRFDGRVDINNGIALGGGAAPTLGTIGGAGPTAAAQAQWVEIDVGGVAHWIPAWT